MVELVEAEPTLGDYAIGFRYFKLAANEFSQEQLLGIQNIVSTLFLAESRPDIDLLTAQFLSLFEREEDRQAISLFFNWFRQLAVHKRLKADDFASLSEAYRSAEEVKSMLQKTFEQWYQEGREEGSEEGIEKERVNIARTMRTRGFALDVIADITGLTTDELKALFTSPPIEDETR